LLLEGPILSILPRLAAQGNESRGLPKSAMAASAKLSTWATNIRIPGGKNDQRLILRSANSNRSTTCVSATKPARRRTMNRPTSIALSTIACLGFGLAHTGTAAAQTADDLVGAWTVTSVDTVRPDGGRSPTFGANPKGSVMFDGSGRYSIIIVRSDLPKFAAANRIQGTPDENKAVVQGSLSLFGDYSVAGKIVTLKIDGASYPNWNGGDQPRTVTSFTNDEIKWSNPAGSGGGIVELTARRVKASTRQNLNLGQ